MGPLEFAIADVGLWAAAREAGEKGRDAARSGRTDDLREIELMSGAAVVGAGALVSLAFGALWPLLVAAGVAVALFGAHELMAARHADAGCGC